jgi:hypothetical protein
MDHREIGPGGIDWIHPAQDRPVEGACEVSNEPPGSINVKKFMSG